VSGFINRLQEVVGNLRQRIVGKDVTVYPSYAYLKGDEWVIPLRVWVHDNRDTPFVEDAIERLAARHFAEDLGRELRPEEKTRLDACLANFIADDKSDEEVEFVFDADPRREVFPLKSRTSPNGIVEEEVRVPAGRLAPLLEGKTGDARWLKITATADGGNGRGSGAVRFLEPTGLSVVSDIDDTVKVTEIPAGRRTVLRNTFLREFRAAEGMRERYFKFVEEAGPSGDVCFHYVSGSPWQLYELLARFLIDDSRFPAGTFHMKNLRKNLLEPGALDTIKAFATGGDLATLDQKVRQITQLMLNLPGRRFILVGDSGERDPEVYRAIRELFPAQVQKVFIRDVLAERLSGVELITGPGVAVSLDTTDLLKEMKQLIADTARSDKPTL
jgi:hypothetical protein